MKTASEDLFHLIHSLRKSEKRSFKVFSSHDKKEKLYVTLFDLIAGQKQYDEEAIIRILKIKKSVFAVYKNHLYNLLLQRMSFMFPGKEAELRGLLTQADFLYSKGLYPLYEKMLLRVKKLAVEYDLDNQLLEILNMEHRNAWRKRDLAKAAAVMEEDKQILSRFNNQREYTHLSNEIIISLSSMGDNRNTREVKKLNALMKNPLIKNDKNALSFRAKYSLYHTLSLYHSVNGRVHKQYEFAKKAAELYEGRPEKIKHDTFTYLLSIHLMLVACYALKKYDEAKKYTDKLRIDPSLLTNEREKIWAFFTFHDTNLEYFIVTGRFAEGIPGAEKLITELSEYAPKLENSHNTVLAFHIAKIYFGAGHYSKCIFWMNRILNESQSLNIRQGIEINIKMLYLIVHYEKGNFDLLHSLVKSTRNELQAKGRLYKFENAMLDFFGRKINRKNKDLSIKAFKALKNELESISKHKNEKMSLEEFDFLSWIESKIENKPFAEIVRKKALN